MFVTNEREETVVKQHNLFRKTFILIMKLHVSACNGHRQVSTTIKKSIYIYIYMGARGGVVVKALRYKPAGRGFDSQWCHWNFSVT